MAAISDKVSTPIQNGDGTNKAFAFDFSIIAPGDIGVYVDGVGKTYPGDYGVVFGDTSGTVTFHEAPAAGAQILLVSQPDYRQTSEFANQGAYNLSTVNTINRRAAIRDLVTEDKASRALKVPLGEPSPEMESLSGAEGKVLGMVGGKIRGIANDAVAIASDVYRAETAANQAEADQAATEEDRAAVADFAEEFADVRSAIATGTVAALIGTRIYSTKAALLADLVPADDLYALVVGDPTAGNNDLYRKNGSTGAGSWDGPLGIFAAASAVAQNLRNQTEALKDEAEVARDGAAASMVSLYAVTSTQTIGRPVTPVTGTAATNNSYAWNDPVITSGNLTQVSIFAMATGTLQVARYTKSGTAMTRVAVSSVVNITSTGLKTLTPADFGVFPVIAGEYLAIYCNGVLAFNSGAADGAGWFNFTPNLPSNGTAGALTPTLRLEAKFTVSIVAQTVTAATFAAIQAVVTENSTAIDNNVAALALLNAPATQIIGRPLGALLIGPSAVGGAAYISADPAIRTGVLDALDYYAYAPGTVTISAFTLAGGAFNRIRFATVTVTSSGIKNLTAADFGNFPVSQGEYLGMSGNGLIGYATQSADVGYYFAAGPTGGAAGSLQTEVRFQYRFSVVGSEQVVTAAAFEALLAGGSGNHLRGKKFGVIGDSLSGTYNQLWQDAFVARTGAVLWRQDARGGRTFSAALEAYGASTPLATLGALGTYSNSAALTGALTSSGTIGQRNIYGQVPADGTTLAQWLADLDFLVLWLGTNDAAAISAGNVPTYAGATVAARVGALTDGYTANTLHGAMNFLLDALLIAKPDLRIIAVNLYRNALAPAATQEAVADAMLANFESRGIPMLNARKTWGINALSASTLLRMDGVHLSDDSFTRIAGPAIAQFAAEQL